MAQVVSGEEYQRMKAEKPASYQPRLPVTFNTKTISIIVVAVVLAVLGFLGGVAYQKGRNTSTTTTSTASNNTGNNSQPGSNGYDGYGGGQGFRSGQRPTIGDVTAVSSTSITIQSVRSGQNTTLTITSSTTVTNNGQTASVSDIKIGDRVFIQTDGNQTATRIMLNPTMGGSPGADTPSSGSTDSQSSDNSTI